MSMATNRVVLLLALLLVHLAATCNRFPNYCDQGEEGLNTTTTSTSTSTTSTSTTTTSTTRREWSRWRRRSSSVLFQSQRVLARQITSTLDTLFSAGYDHQIRPRLNGQPVEVSLNLVIRSMGPVDEQKQTFSLDCYLRQYWQDDRLRYNTSMTSVKELHMNWQFLFKIWRPDTFILNGQRSYLHKMTVPNRFIRIAPNGLITYSQRLTVKARCQMDLHKFPLDAQNCPLEFGSFGHNADDLVYRWSPLPIAMDQLELAQYNLANYSKGIFDGIHPVLRRNVSTITLNFTFQRQQGFYLLQIYIPLTLIVCCSWVTFWLSKTEKGTEIPARTSLGASSVLSVVTVGFGGKSKPQVAYATALDVFIILCFINVFAALVEFAFLNFLDTLVRRLKRRDKESRLVLLMAEHNILGARRPRIPKRQESMIDTDGILCDEGLLTPEEEEEEEEEEDPAPQRREDQGSGGQLFEFVMSEERQSRSLWTRTVDIIIDVLTFCNCRRSVRSMEIYRKPYVVFNRVDKCSRRIFPLTFLLLNVAYWAGYMYLP